MNISYDFPLFVTVTELEEYDTEISLKMTEEKDSENIISWIDKGSQYDRSVCKFRALVNKVDLPKMELLKKARNENRVIQIFALLDGFKPFGWHKDHSGTIDVTIKDIKPLKQRSIFATVQKYEITMSLKSTLPEVV